MKIPFFYCYLVLCRVLLACWPADLSFFANRFAVVSLCQVSLCQLISSVGVGFVHLQRRPKPDLWMYFHFVCILLSRSEFYRYTGGSRTGGDSATENRRQSPKCDHYLSHRNHACLSSRSCECFRGVYCFVQSLRGGAEAAPYDWYCGRSHCNLFVCLLCLTGSWTANQASAAKSKHELFCLLFVPSSKWLNFLLQAYRNGDWRW